MSACQPSAVLSWPMVLPCSANMPLAVLLLPLLLLTSAKAPVAVFWWKPWCLLMKRAAAPVPVL